ncbi:MAG: M48 family metallopeptidase, partial [Verrucomicrobiae bacterium]|nr:M48 family metallopeptidase [Verrucomicrobiae bacterium]
NVVEEMAIASGVPVPDVYVLGQERSINAFAAGLKPGDAVIGVTRGCIQMLTRDELQGVIAHEFSHILNGDMRLNLRLIGWLNGILCLAMLGYYLLRIGFYSGSGGGGGGGKKGGNPLPLIGLALVVIGFTGVFFGRLIKSAVSRQREFLADASAVQFTRNPDGIVGALKKIGGLMEGSRVMSPAAEEASHMFFGNGLKPPLFGSMLATHPPLVERIRVWEPNFTGSYPPVKKPVAEAIPTRPRRAAGKPPISLGGLVGGIAAAGALGTGGAVAGRRSGATGRVEASTALQHAGTPTLDHLEHASGLLEDIPESLREATQQPFAATALVYGVLLASANEADQEAQLATLPPPVVHEIKRLLPALRELPARLRLPLFELGLPALRQLSPRQFEDLETTVRRLIEADSEIDLFEYAVLKLLARHLTPTFRPVRRRTAMLYALNPVTAECVVLLSGLAHVGQADEAGARAAYEVGLRKLELSVMEHPLLEAGSANLSQIDAALDRLVQLALPLRRRLLDACALAVAQDGKLAEREAELLRAIADTLECPLPP